MTSYVRADLRRLVRRRAESLCEYCLIHEEDTFLGCQVDRVISEKHGGATEESNLAFACALCNRSKGSDVGSVSPGDGAFSRLFHPRTDRWADHFSLQGLWLNPETVVGEVTAFLLGLNRTERLIEREALAKIGRYPSPAARKVISGQAG